MSRFDWRRGVSEPLEPVLDLEEVERQRRAKIQAAKKLLPATSGGSAASGGSRSGGAETALGVRWFAFIRLFLYPS